MFCHSNESYRAVLSCGTVYYIQGVQMQGATAIFIHTRWFLLTLKSVDVLFINKVVLTFKSLDETLVCDHSNGS